MPQKLPKKITPDIPLSTGQVAKLLNFSYQTVVNWTSRGMLKFYRIPGIAKRVQARHRRILAKDLMAFVKKYELPMPKELTDENS